MMRGLFFVIGLLPVLATAQIVQSDTRLMNGISYYEDLAGSFTLEQARQAYAQGEFERHDSDGAINFGLSKSTYWIRFTLEAETSDPTQHLLEVGFYALTDVTLFHPDGKRVQSGKNQPVQERPWPHRHLVFPIELSAQQPSTFFLRVASAGSITVPLAIWTADSFAYHTQTEYLWLAVYYGAAGALFFYNLFLFASVRDRNYLTYCGFLWFTASAVFLMNGFGAYTLAVIGVPDTIGTNSFFAVSGLFAIWFLRGFLQTAQHLKRIDYLLQILSAAFIVIAALPLLDVPVRVGVGLLSLLGVIVAPIMLIITIISWWRGHHSARFLLIAWSVLLVGVSIQAARNFGLIPTTWLTSNLLQIGSLADMLLLSFALADRIQTVQKNAEKAQAQALKAQTELTEGLKNSERRLEGIVQSRTKSLQKAYARERATLEEYVEFGALIAHEFRNPLAIVLNQTQLARIEQHNGTKNLDNRFAAIERASNRLQILFDQWLASDRLTARTETIDKVSIALQDWLPSLLYNYSSTNPDQVHMSIKPAHVEADEALLASAVYNLVDNAMKYSPNLASIEVFTRIEANNVGIAVRDQGPGIPMNERTRIFDKHHRAATNSSRKGLGLGLYFVTEVMSVHDGWVTLDSKVGEGSTFTLWLPAKDDDSNQAKTRST